MGDGAFLAFSWSKSVYSGGWYSHSGLTLALRVRHLCSLCVLEKLSHGFHWSYVKFNS